MGTVITKVVKLVKRDVIGTTRVKAVVVTLTQTVAGIALRASAAASWFALQLREDLALLRANGLMRRSMCVVPMPHAHAGRSADHRLRLGSVTRHGSSSPGC
ncbi:MAG: hypothetical protein D6741_19385 [Planctomycetota bacterium]|nr:MAG: hypothetical protein D6741_19385 [Planctomycetota bacterium]